MAELSGLDMVREIIGQINNLRRLVTINGKKYKWDGKKYVRAVDGKKFTKKELVSFVKDEKFEAPKTPKARKGELKVDGKTVYKKRDIKGDLKSKAQGLKSKALKIGKQGLNKGNQVLQNAKLRMMQPGGQAAVANRQQLLNQYIKGLTPRTFMGGVTKGAAGLVADNLMMSGANQLIDRGARALGGMNNMPLADFRAMRDQRLADLNSGKFKEDLKVLKNIKNNINSIENPEQTGGVIGRRVRPETPPNANTDTSKVTRETNPTQAKEKVKIKAGGFNPNAPDMGYGTKKTKNKKLKVNKRQKRREKAIRRAYGNISDKRMKQLLSRAVTQRELEES